MLRMPAVRRKSPGRQNVRPVPLPVPLGGINRTNSATAMSPNFALELTNCIRVDDGVSVRPGYTTVQNGDLASVFVYNDGAGERIVTCGGGKIFIDGIEAASGFTSDNWNAVNFGRRLIMVNGTDTPQSVIGSTVQATTWTGIADPTRLSNVAVFRNRLYFIEADSTAFWYGGVDAVQGGLDSFDLGYVGEQGGKIVAIGVSLGDGGEGGADDMIVFFTDTGETLVYSGSNPSDYLFWNHVGTFNVGRPIAVRRTGSDLLCVTHGGVFMFSTLLQGGPPLSTGLGQAFHNRLASMTFGAMVAEVDHTRGLYILSDSVRQYVYAPRYDFWSEWVGIDALDSVSSPSGVYFVNGNGLHQLNDTPIDDTAPVMARIQTAWTDLGVASRKHLKQVKLLFADTGGAAAKIAIAADFNDAPTGRDVYGLDGESDADSAQWNLALWNIAKWGVEKDIFASWQGGGAKIGTYFSSVIEIESNGEAFNWVGLSALYETGGVM